MRQKSKLSGGGSLVNHFMSNNSSLPEVGKGATEMHYTDRSVYEVVEVSPDKKRVRLEALDAEWDRTKPGGTGHQNWVFKPTGNFKTVVWRNHRGGGNWYEEANEVTYTKEYRSKFPPDTALATTLTDEQHKIIYAGDVWPRNELPGITKKVKRYYRIRILFGRKDYYYDWEF